MVLLTGATGLVGSHLALHLLQQGDAVRAIFRNGKSTDFTKKIFRLYEGEALFDRIEWVQADLTDVPSLEGAFHNIEEVYHCAAFISFNRNDEELLRKTNIEGTANIVNLSIAHNIRKLCFVSSIAALGDLKPHEDFIDEETEWNAEKHHSDYAITKYGAEMEIWRGQQEGLQTIIVNPGVILGPTPKVNGKSQGSGEIFTTIENELPFYTTGSTGFIAVTDTVAVMRKLMKSEISGERFALIEANYTFREIANKIADASNVKRPWKHAKPWLTAISWKTDWLLGTLFGKRRVLYKDMAQSLHEADRYSNNKILEATGHEFISMQEYVGEVAGLRKKIT